MKAEIQIVHCDSLLWLEEAASKTPARFDCIITDPPYDSLMKWQGVGTTARMGFGKGKDAASSDRFYECISADAMWGVLMAFDQLLKNNAHCYVMADHEYMPLILAWAREGNAGHRIDFGYSKPLVWDKVSMGMGYHWRGTHEYVVMLEKGKRRLNNLGWSDVLRHKRVTGGYPTEKPFGLIEQLVLNSTNPGEWVLDPFGGSGVTAAVCARHGRNCVTLDKSDRAIEHMQKRIAEITQELI